MFIFQDNLNKESQVYAILMVVFLIVSCACLLLLLVQIPTGFVVLLSLVYALIALWFGYQFLWSRSYKFCITSDNIVVVSIFGQKEMEIDELETYYCRCAKSTICKFKLTSVNKQIIVFTRHPARLKEILHQHYVFQNQWRSECVQRIISEEFAFLKDFGFDLKDTSTLDKARIEFSNERIYFAYCRTYRFGEELLVVAQSAQDCYDYNYLATFNLHDEIFRTVFNEYKKLYPKKAHVTTKLLAYYLKKQLENKTTICGFEY